MSRSRELCGYAVWGAIGLLIAVPEVWALVGGSSVGWPTISGTVGYLEYWHPWVAVIVVAILVWAAFHAVRYETRGHGAPSSSGSEFRTAGGRLSRRPPHGAALSALTYLVGASAVVVGVSLWSYLDRPDDRYRLGEVLYGSIAVLFVIVPALVAYFAGRDAPFPTLFATIQALERRSRAVAVALAAAITVLLIHLALYPWPAVLPDLQDLHNSRQEQPYRVKKEQQPQPGAP